ncbi:MAG: DMT family transporter [Candidatus Methanomethylophilaceae archaeon]
MVDRDLFKVRKKDLLFFILFGFFKLMSDVTLFRAQVTIELSLSTLLQMTAPYYVLVISLFLFKERITLMKILAMLVAFIGCIFVTGVITGGMHSLDFVGVASALISGLFFGLYTIGCKLSSDKGYKPVTTMMYMFLFASLMTIPFANDVKVVESFVDVHLILGVLSLGVLMTLIPFFVSTWGVQKLEASKVSLISVMEVITACIVGYFLFDEEMTVLNIIGMSLVVASIVIMDLKINREIRKRKTSESVDVSE